MHEYVGGCWGTQVRHAMLPFFKMFHLCLRKRSSMLLYNFVYSINIYISIYIYIYLYSIYIIYIIYIKKIYVPDQPVGTGHL